MLPLLKVRFVVLAAACVFLCSCQTPVFQYSEVSMDDHGILYLYRPRSPDPGRQPLLFKYPEVFIDGISHGPLKANEYLVIELPQGKHDLKLTGLTAGSNWSQRDKVAVVDIKAGGHQFVKLNIRFNLDEMQLGNPGPKYRIYLTPRAEADAIYEIRETKRAPER